MHRMVLVPAFTELMPQVWDLGGQASLRPSWASYYRSTDAVIMVLDSTDRARVRIAKVCSRPECQLPSQSAIRLGSSPSQLHHRQLMDLQQHQIVQAIFIDHAMIRLQ